jgi:predicted membrane channel-forming protein YqfA (hemolysin III family)
MYYIDANRFPEKFFPGKFDFAGLTSHAIWHVFVCLGIFVSSHGIMMLFLPIFLTSLSIC